MGLRLHFSLCSPRRRSIEEFCEKWKVETRPRILDHRFGLEKRDGKRSCGGRGCAKHPPPTFYRTRRVLSLRRRSCTTKIGAGEKFVKRGLGGLGVKRARFPRTVFMKKRCPTLLLAPFALGDGPCPLLRPSKGVGQYYARFCSSEHSTSHGFRPQTLLAPGKDPRSDASLRFHRSWR